MASIAIITARGGSKRIPKKNIKEFCGKPIIAYSIEAALASGVFDEVMVSTDSEEIADIARQYNAKVPFYRSNATSNDYAVTSDVIEEVLSEYRNRGQCFDAFACVYPTAPFVTGTVLSNAFALLEDVDAVIPVVKYSFPPQRSFLIKNECLEYLHPEFEKTRSQDLEPLYHDCGLFYFCKTEVFETYHSLILPRTKAIIMSETEIQDIDTISDWIIAEEKYKRLHCKNDIEN